MSRHIVIAERERAAARAAVTHPDTEELLKLHYRRLRFIEDNRLSPAEAADLPASFNPGPEYNYKERD